MRTIIFRDAYGNRISARKFYELFPRIKELDHRTYFNFNQLAGYCERTEFFDDNGYIAGEITVLNKGNDKYDLDNTCRV